MSQAAPEALKNVVEMPREVSGAATQDDQLVESSLRPRTLAPVLFFSPPGWGKTTLSQIIASEMDATLKSVSAPAIERGGDLAAVLTNLQEGEVLFIDEIHRLKPQIQEVLYPAMEDYQLDIMIGQG